ncbi:hypothetical protein NM688_g474 [Phlebia brevispora]|uniref:Uncharacterized protein n=1 Tax=Phlebia brevispora TaxID=194682 RepID=A0ACC1TE15_9APHY|nr:hypothetical protein NM688_g474 [Phlebia brevispora]
MLATPPPSAASDMSSADDSDQNRGSESPAREARELHFFGLAHTDSDGSDEDADTHDGGACSPVGATRKRKRISDSVTPAESNTAHEELEAHQVKRPRPDSSDSSSAATSMGPPASPVQMFYLLREELDIVERQLDRCKSAQQSLQQAILTTMMAMLVKLDELCRRLEEKDYCSSPPM